MGKKLTTEYVKNIVKNFGCGLVGEYVLAKNKVTLLCPCGKEWDVIFHMFIKKGHSHRCPECSWKLLSKRFRKSIDKIKEYNILQENGYFLLEKDDYVDSKTRVAWKDSLGYKYYLPLRRIIATLENGFSPEKFSVINKYTFDNISLWIKKENKKYSLLSTNDSSRILYINLICNTCGCKWSSRWGDIWCGNSCPKCGESRGEKGISDFLSKRGINYFPQHRFKDCKNIICLVFDFYLPKDNVCIEYQGKQHYKPIDFGGKGLNWAKIQLKKQKIKDKIKDEYCLEKGIILYKIPYWNFKNINSILTELLL